MAKPAGQLEEITLDASNNKIQGNHRVSLTKALTGAAALVKNALAWVAEEAGASTLASQISGLSNTDEFNTAYFYRMSLKDVQDSLILCVVTVRNASGLDIDNTREYEFTRSGLQAALANVAGDFSGSLTPARTISISQLGFFWVMTLI